MVSHATERLAKDFAAIPNPDTFTLSVLDGWDIEEGDFIGFSDETLVVGLFPELAKDQRHSPLLHFGNLIGLLSRFISGDYVAQLAGEMLARRLREASPAPLSRVELLNDVGNECWRVNRFKADIC
jgi:hypothetical protein